MQTKTSHCASDSCGNFAYKVGMKTTIVAMYAWLSLIMRHYNVTTNTIGWSQEKHHQHVCFIATRMIGIWKRTSWTRARTAAPTRPTRRWLNSSVGKDRQSIPTSIGSLLMNDPIHAQQASSHCNRCISLCHLATCLVFPTLQWQGFSYLRIHTLPSICTQQDRLQRFPCAVFNKAPSM